MSTNIVILAAGPVAFGNIDGGYPLCLTEVDGVPLLEKLVNSTKNIRDSKYIYAFLDEDVERFHLDHVAQLITPEAKVVRVPRGTQGSACTALVAASTLNADAELLIISANELVDVSLSEVLGCFRRQGLDGGVVSFRSIHPRYSYVRLGDDGYVIEASQQNPISQYATAGVFWFARTNDFVEAVKNSIRKNSSMSGRFYVAPTYNELILRQKRVGVFGIENSQYHPLKSERQMHKFEQGGYE